MPKTSITVRLPEELVERVHQQLVEMQGDKDWPRVSRTDVIQALLEEALSARETAQGREHESPRR